MRDEFAKSAVPGGSLRPRSPGGGGYSFKGAGRFSPTAGGVTGYFEAMHRRPIAARLEDGTLSLARVERDLRRSGHGGGRRAGGQDGPSSPAAPPQQSPRSTAGSPRQPESGQPQAGPSSPSKPTRTDPGTAPRFAAGSIAAKFWDGVPEHLRRRGVLAVERGERAKRRVGRPISDRQWQRLAGVAPTSPRALLLGPDGGPGGSESKGSRAGRPPRGAAKAGRVPTAPAVRRSATGRLTSTHVVRPRTATQVASDPLQHALGRARVPQGVVEEAKESLRASRRVPSRGIRAGRLRAWASEGGAPGDETANLEGPPLEGGADEAGEGGLSSRMPTPTMRGTQGLSPRREAGDGGSSPMQLRPGTGQAAMRGGGGRGAGGGAGQPGSTPHRTVRMRPQSSRARLISDDTPRGSGDPRADERGLRSDGAWHGEDPGVAAPVPSLRLDRLLAAGSPEGAVRHSEAGGDGEEPAYDTFVVHAPGVRVSSSRGNRIEAGLPQHSPMQLGGGSYSLVQSARSRFATPASPGSGAYSQLGRMPGAQSTRLGLVRYQPKPPVAPLSRPMPGTTDRRIAAFRARRAVMQAVVRRQREDMRSEYEKAGARKRARLWLQFAALMSRVGRMHEAIRRRRSERLGASMMKALGMHKRRIFNAWRALTKRSKLIWATIVFKRVLKPAVRRFREAVLAEHVRRIATFLRYVRDMNDAIKTCRVFYGQLLRLQAFWLQVRETTRSQLFALGRQWDRASLMIRAKGLKQRLLRERRRSQVGRTMLAIEKKQAAARPKAPTLEEALAATDDAPGFRPGNKGGRKPPPRPPQRAGRQTSRDPKGGRASRSSGGGRASRSSAGGAGGGGGSAVQPESLARIGRAATSTAGSGAVVDSFLDGGSAGVGSAAVPRIEIRPTGRMSPGHTRQGSGLGVADLGTMLVRRTQTEPASGAEVAGAGSGGERDAPGDGDGGPGAAAGGGDAEYPRPESARAAAQPVGVREHIELARRKAQEALGGEGGALRATHSVSSLAEVGAEAEGSEGQHAGPAAPPAGSPVRRQQEALPRFKQPADEEKHWEAILQSILVDAEQRAAGKGSHGASGRPRRGRRASVDRSGHAESEVARKTLQGIDVPGSATGLDIDTLAAGAKPRAGRRLSVEMHSMQLQTIVDFPPIPLPRRTVLLRKLLHQRRSEHRRRVLEFRRRLAAWESQLEEELGLAEARISAIKGEVSKGEKAMLRDYMLQRKPRRPVWTPLPAFRFMLDFVEHELLEERKRQAALRAAGVSAEDVEDAVDVLGS